MVTHCECATVLLRSPDNGSVIYFLDIYKQNIGFSIKMQNLPQHSLSPLFKTCLSLAEAQQFNLKIQTEYGHLRRLEISLAHIETRFRAVKAKNYGMWAASQRTCHDLNPI